MEMPSPNNLSMPWYRIAYCPTRRTSGFGLNIYLPRKFPEFVSPIDFNKERYERFAGEMLEVHGFKPVIYRDSRCIWKNGLLWAVKVPGNAAGLAIQLTGIDAPMYAPDNIDSPAQMSMALAVAVRYLTEIQYKFFA